MDRRKACQLASKHMDTPHDTDSVEYFAAQLAAMNNGNGPTFQFLGDLFTEIFDEVPPNLIKAARPFVVSARRLAKSMPL